MVLFRGGVVLIVVFWLLLMVVSGCDFEVGCGGLMVVLGWGLGGLGEVVYDVVYECLWWDTRMAIAVS